MGLPAEMKENHIQKQFAPQPLRPEGVLEEEESQDVGDDKDLTAANTFGFGYYSYPRYYNSYYPSYHNGYYGGYRNYGYGRYYSPYRYYGWY